MSHEQDVATIVLERLAADKKLTELKEEARELGGRFEELAHKLKALSKVTTETVAPKSTEDTNKNQFLESLKPGAERTLELRTVFERRHR